MDVLFLILSAFGFGEASGLPSEILQVAIWQPVRMHYYVNADDLEMVLRCFALPAPHADSRQFITRTCISFEDFPRSYPKNSYSRGFYIVREPIPQADWSEVPLPDNILDQPPDSGPLDPGFVRNKMAIMMERRKSGSSKTVVSLKHPGKLSSLLRPDNTAHVRALETLLRNPIKFTERINHDKHKMANSVSDRIVKWRSNRDQREKNRRTVMRYLSKAWEPYMVLQGIRSFGLFNTGVTCYRNASIQVLMHLPIFLNWLEEYHHPDDCQTRGECVACHLRRMKLAFWAQYPRPTQRTSVVRRATNEMNRNLKPMGWKEPENVQHDSREFLLWMLMTIWQQLPKNQTDIFDAMFGVVADEEIECANCRTSRFLGPKNETTTPDFTLFTDLVDTKEGSQLINVIRRNFYTQRQARCENPACGDNGDKTRRQFITLAPEVLICPLKRFEGRWNPKSKKMASSKIGTKIVFPELLDLSKFHGHPKQQIGGQLLYRLSSVIYHSGTLDGGHYINIARGPDNVWREMSDQTVSDVELWTALAREGYDAYVLTYTKQNGSAIA